MRLFGSGRRPAWAAVPGEKTLAAAKAADGERWLLGTRRALSVVSATAEPVTHAWDQIQSSDWNADEHTLRLSLIGTFGEPRERASYVLVEPDLLLQLVRERITASIVFQRHVPVEAKSGFRVIARRNPAGGPITWMCDFDPGIEPDAPGMPERVETALAQARMEIGEPI